MRRGQAKLVDDLIAYEREWLEERDRYCKLHHTLDYLGLSRHSQVIRCLALAVLEKGEDDTKEWVREWMLTDPEGCYIEYELKAAIDLSRKLRRMFKSTP